MDSSQDHRLLSRGRDELHRQTGRGPARAATGSHVKVQSNNPHDLVIDPQIEVSSRQFFIVTTDSKVIEAMLAIEKHVSTLSRPT